MAKRSKQSRDSIWRRWARRLSGEPAPAEREPRRAAGRSGAPRKPTTEKSARKTATVPDAASELAAFEKELRTIAAAQASVQAGRLQLLNIGHVAAHFGAKWPKVVDRVHGIIERALRNRLGARDIFRRHRELFYVVVFADIGGAEARARMALVSDEINAMLFGDEDDLAPLELRSAVFDVDGKLMLEAYSATDAIGAYADEQAAETGMPDTAPGEREVSAPDDDSAAPPPVAALAENADEDAKLREVKRAHEMIQARLQHIQTDSTDDQNREVEYRMLHDLEDELLRLHDRLAQRVPLVEREAPKMLKTGAGAAVDEESTYPRPATLLLMEAENAFMANDHDRRHFISDEHDLSLRFSYRPVWYVDARVIGTYFVTAHFQEDGVDKTAERAFRKKLSDDVNALIDRCLLRRALLDIAATDRSATSIVAVPVHYATLRHVSHRRTFQYLLHSIPNWCREHLAWEILDAPLDALRTQIDEATSVLRPFGRTVMWRTPLRGAKLPNLATTSVNSASIHLNDSSHVEAQIFEEMNVWCAAAEEARLKTYVRGADTRSLAVAAVSAGFDRIAGDAVGERIDTFKGVMSFSTEQMYMSMVSEAFDRQ
ncbi:MAG: hypothetical protein ACFE0S_13395 [Rhodospirillales bacterium]